MSLIDFTVNLFRDQARARAFADNPVQTLRDAGLPDVTPADVHALLPTVAESMPPDHPLQSLVREPQPVVEPVDPNVGELDPRVTTTAEDLGGGLDPRVTTTAEDLGGGLDPRVTTTAQDLGGGLDPRVTTTAEDLGGGLDPRVTTTTEDLSGSDTSWTPYEEAMDWTVCPPEEPEISYEQPEISYEQTDSYSADQSGYESASATQSTAGPEIIS